MRGSTHVKRLSATGHAIPSVAPKRRTGASGCAAHLIAPEGFVSTNLQSVVARASDAGAVLSQQPGADSAADAEFLESSRPVKCLIAGAGIGGLVLAVALLKKGINVQMFERDLTAIRGEGKYRGPIQIQSNALAALEAIDADMAREIMDAGCVTGDRINGLCDGVTGEWYVKFDTYHPAVDNGMPVTRVVSRVTLQNILAKYAMKYGGEGVIMPDCRVDSFEEDSVEGHDRVWAVLQDGSRHWGDFLIGADGIWSRVRKQLIGHTEPNYSEYTCYTGISDFVCPDIDTVGYRVFLGNGQYFVSSDVGGGKMQWYGFHKEPAGGTDEEGCRKQRLMDIFGNWHHMVTDLIAATPEDDVLRRDIFDRPPIFKWTEGRVALLGDSAHAMQPNLGQGGCMAIEDAYELAKLLTDDGTVPAAGDPRAVPFGKVLKEYESHRMMRASAIHGMAGMAAFAASTYKAYLGEGLGPLSFIEKLHIPHPGRVAGRVVLKYTMPFVLGWVLGGNIGALKAADRATYCSIADKPRGFDESEFGLLMRDDEELLKAAHADWVLAPMCRQGEVAPKVSPALATALEDNIVLGREPSADVPIDDPSVSPRHARVEVEDGKYYLVDESSERGTFLNKRRLRAGARAQLHPGDAIELGDTADGPAFRVKMMHPSQRAVGLVSSAPDGSELRQRVSFRDGRRQPSMAEA